MVITQFHITPKTARSNNGHEFLLHQFYASKGILRQRLYVENSQQKSREKTLALFECRSSHFVAIQTFQNILVLCPSICNLHYL